MVGELSLEEKREISREISDFIYNWAEKSFGSARAYTVMCYVRALAKNAAMNRTGNQRGQLCQNREEANDVKEAAQDIMEVIDSIRWKLAHKEAAE